MENNNKEEEVINPQEEGTPEEEQEGDEMLDDNYILQLHQYLQEMKRQRKEAEQNTNLLNGRLRCLRDEVQKTLKKSFQAKLSRLKAKLVWEKEKEFLF